MRRSFYLVSLGLGVLILTACPIKEVQAQGTVMAPAGPSSNAGSAFSNSTSVNPGTMQSYSGTTAGTIMTPGTAGGFGNTVPGSSLPSSGAAVIPNAPPPTIDGLSPNPGTLNMTPISPGAYQSGNYSSPFNTQYAQPNAMNAIDNPPGVMPRVDDMNRPNSNTGQNDINSPGSRGAGVSPF